MFDENNSDTTFEIYLKTADSSKENINTIQNDKEVKHKNDICLNLMYFTFTVTDQNLFKFSISQVYSELPKWVQLYQ